MAAERQEFGDDLAVFRPGETFFRGEAATMRRVGEHLLAVGRSDETDEHLFEREGRDGLEREVHLAGEILALDGETAHEETVAGQHRGFLRFGAREGARERGGHLVRVFAARTVGLEGWAEGVGSVESSVGLGAGGAPLSSSQARIWNG